MPCSYLKLPGGGVAIVKHAAPRAKRCSCGDRAPFLCDWKMGQDKTCDKPMCAAHALEVAPDKHLCRDHQAAWRQHPLFQP